MRVISLNWRSWDLFWHPQISLACIPNYYLSLIVVEILPDCCQLARVRCTSANTSHNRVPINLNREIIWHALPKELRLSLTAIKHTELQSDPGPARTKIWLLPGLKLFQTSLGQLIFSKYFTTYFHIFLHCSDSKSINRQFLFLFHPQIILCQPACL